MNPYVRAALALRISVLLLAMGAVCLAGHAYAVAEENKDLRSALEQFQRDLWDEGLIEEIDALAEKVRLLADEWEGHHESPHSPEDER